MLMRKQKLGLTLTSIMVAVGLSGILAVAGVRLVTNQMNALRVMELIDKGDSIYKFYSNLLHDDKVWWCTLYDGKGSAGSATVPPSPNKALRDCVFGSGGCFSGTAGTAMQLMGPDCKFHEPTIAGKVKHRFEYKHLGSGVGGLDFTTPPGLQFERSPTTLIDAGGKTLRDSVMRPAAGWWTVEVRWQEMGNNAVDLIFTQKFDADKWRAAPAAGKRHLPELNYPRALRVRRSTNYVSGETDCSDKAAVEIALHTLKRDVTCGQQLVKTGGTLGSCPSGGGLFGGVVESTELCSHVAKRVSVTPTDCSVCSSVIWQIGDVLTGRDDNVKCALNGFGKMIDYGGPAGTADDCNILGPKNNQLVVPTSQHRAITHISAGGKRQYATLMGWPASVDVKSGGHTVDGQGPMGERGCAGWGPVGLRGAACPATPGGGTTWVAREVAPNPTCPSLVSPPRPLRAGQCP